jgi:tetratricopeptide (TPR) repeat protein
MDRDPATKNVANVEFQAQLSQATELLAAGRAAEALPLLEELVSSQSQNEDAVLNLSAAYILLKKFSRAVSLLEPLASPDQPNPVFFVNLGAAYLGNPVLAQDDDRQKAIAAFSQALARDPAAPNVAYNIGLIYRDQGDYDWARHWFQRALANNPGDRDARRLLDRLETPEREQAAPAARTKEPR